MLSYQHEFHAGNHADILKHIVVLNTARYFVRKDSPVLYVDTHAGAGKYSINDERTQQTGEMNDGILRLLNYAAQNPAAVPKAAAPYLAVCRQHIENQKQYPGSPEIVRSCMREQDEALLSELHPAEIRALKSYAKTDKRLHVHYRSGFEVLDSLLPPRSPLPRRGFALIDPGYEDAEEYDAVIASVSSAVRRWNAGTFIIWFPLVARRRKETELLKRRLSACCENRLYAELCIRQPASIKENGRVKNLYGSGVIVLRPVQTLKQELSEILPWAAAALGEKSAHFFVDSDW
ncbi:MAG: 23S rRNA (adenine(2030)-N(6))-methyltransferase RlmJ [Bacteroides sp.]|nr:23S rRNA (adenine(2030)-N(6))-methyltransferase RlmJ [Prevotella sp.]MCM1407556.1 23S rRNA (adenine(2030)-N(6))-methyltransferase RlmJ [Treponema brennaborense]MCM1469294.1 23S rRNA (adenine(2030)-N(6))-methyltransferase RlmJ [Bacteroides sp.]